MERSWIVRVFHHELTTPPSSAQLQRRGGEGVVGFSADRLIKVAHCFSRWFMNIYMHKLFWKMKINLQPDGR